MFEENENLVEEETTENVEEQTTEENVQDDVEFTDTTDKEEPVEEKEPEKLYTEADLNNKLNDLLAKKLAIKENKIRREYQKKYDKAERVIKAGLGTDDFDEGIDTLEQFYEQKGVKIPKKSSHSEEEETILADYYAQKIIESGYDDIVAETDRLAKIGKDNLDSEELKMFMKLAEARQNIEEESQLAKLGIKREDLDDDFNNFASSLNPKLSLLEKYEMYLKFKPKEKIETIGSMKDGQDSNVKESYTEAEISKMSLDDLDKPGVWDAVRRSMTSE